MRVNIQKVKTLMVQTALKKGLTKKEARFVAGQYCEAELRGKATHGVGKFCWDIQYFPERERAPEIVMDRGSLILVDGHKEIGQLAAEFCTELVIKRAKRYGIAAVGMKDCQQYGTLDCWVRRIAQRNLIGIVVNSCQPAVTAYGGISKILGTNPIAVGIPTSNNPIILDMATSKVSMSLIWQALREKCKLPRNTFLDFRGKYTTNPRKAESVEPFGAHKGYGLSLIIQILSGSLITAKMGFEIKDMYDIGYFFQALDLSAFQPVVELKKQNDLLMKQIKESKRKKDVSRIYIPGERSEERKAEALKKGYVDLLDETWNSLLSLQSSEKHANKQ